MTERVNGVDLEYIEAGTGTPVVFSHGAGCDLRYWEPQREAPRPPLTGAGSATDRRRHPIGGSVGYPVADANTD